MDIDVFWRTSMKDTDLIFLHAPLDKVNVLKLEILVIFETKNVYLQNEIHLGACTEQLFDVTPYESCKEISFQGPLLLLSGKFIINFL